MLTPKQEELMTAWENMVVARRAYTELSFPTQYLDYDGDDYKNAEQFRKDYKLPPPPYCRECGKTTIDPVSHTCECEIPRMEQAHRDLQKAWGN